MALNSRSRDIVNSMHEYHFHIMGCGAIGSSTAIQLARMGAEKFSLYDFDIVEDVNVGVSQFTMNDVGLLKVEALQNHIESINPDTRIYAYNGIVKNIDDYKHEDDNDIGILGFDSMESRLNAVTAMCSDSKYKPLCIVDGRMGAEQFQQYIFDKPTVNSYKKTWYPDSEGDPEPCNAKATSYCSNMSGSFIVNAIRKYVTKQPYDKEICFNFPAMMLGKKR